jgi:DNA polymerase/3'-5' exonuclease PolX
MGEIKVGVLKGYQLEGEVTPNSKLTLAKPNGEVYNINITEEGSVFCSCKGFQYRLYCKHSEFLRSMVVFPKVVKRISRVDGLKLANEIFDALFPLFKTNQVTKLQVAGSLRREKSTIKDIDIVLIGDQKAVFDAIKGLSSQGITPTAQGDKILQFVLKDIPVDLRFTTNEAWGACLMFYTGSMEWNVKQRSQAKAGGWKINEYGLWGVSGDYLAGRTEEEIYEKMNWDWVEPKDRETV